MRAAAAARRIVGAGPLDDDNGDVARRARRVAKNAVAADCIRCALELVVAVIKPGSGSFMLPNPMTFLSFLKAAASKDKAST